MSRSKGSASSTEAKTISKELEQLSGKPYKNNFDYLRLIELLIVYRVAERICEFPEDADIEDKDVTVEIPLIGNLTISPRKFHAQHRLTNEPSLHFNFRFEPLSCFKSDLLKAYSEKSTDLTTMAANLYSERLKELYNRLDGE
jgi:hypothetical protein